MVSTGNAAMISRLVTSAVQVNTGIFISGIPGVRILRMVMKKLMPLSVVPRPATCSAQM
ncbi:hypothetical protein D3C71_1011740 [compost metagenome]